MGQSLSGNSKPSTAEGSGSRDTGYAMAAAGLSLVLAAVAIVDQLGSAELLAHAEGLYAAHGVAVSGGLIYGLLYAVAAVNVLAWLGVALGATTRVRWHFLAATGVAALLTLAMGVTLLTAGEYGGQVFPARWGLLALLPLAAALVGLLRFRRWTR